MDKNHFKRWANGLLMISLVGEQKTAQVAANKLLRLDDPAVAELSVERTVIFNSKVHNCEISSHDFKDFLEDTCLTTPKLD